MTDQPAKPRRLQSDISCAAVSRMSGEPCKFTAKKGMRYCGQHIKAIERWNERVTEHAVIVPQIMDDAPVFFGNLFFAEGEMYVTYQFVIHIDSGLDEIFSLPASEVQWETVRRLTSAELKNFVKETTLPNLGTTGE